MVDQGRKLSDHFVQKCLEDLLMNPTHNESKWVVAAKFVRTLMSKVSNKIQLMTSW